MRAALVIFTAALVFSGFAALAAAQDNRTAAGPLIADQPDCPLRISTDGVPTRAPVPIIKLTNAGDRPIRAYVLISDEMTSTAMRPEQPIEPGKFVFQSAHYIRDAKQPLTVDYVEYTDGSSWGSDKAGRSKIIAEYFAGRELAVKRLHELLGTADPTDFLNALHVFGAYTLSAPTSPPRPSSMDSSQRLRGYRNVIESLRKMSKRTEEGQDLARKLELMEKILN